MASQSGPSSSKASKGKSANRHIPSCFAYLRQLKPEELYSAQNPTGVLNMALAENLLTRKVIVEKVHEKIASKPLPLDIANYSSVSNVLPDFQKELHNFFARTIFRDYKTPEGVSKLKTENLIVGIGAGPLISTLHSALCNDGDGVLLSTPAYAGFDNHVQAYPNATPVYFDILSDEDPRGARITKEILDHALENAISHDGVSRIRTLLIATPHNPIGLIFTEDEIKLLIEWCESNKVHLIMDEIYALSSFGGKFVSIATVLSKLNRGFGDYIHFIWSFSKDFCLSGLRLGVLYSENETVLKNVDDLHYFAETSNLAIETGTRILRDVGFVDSFLVLNNKNLKEAYDSLASSLSKYDIPFLPAESGLFVLIDLSKYLGGKTYPNTFAGENSLSTALVHQEKISFTPGEVMHCTRPGYFRICYARYENDVVRESIDRLARFLSTIK